MSLFASTLRILSGLALFGVLGLMLGCDAGTGPGADSGERTCVLDPDNLREGTDRFSVVALSDPPLLSAQDSELRPDDRVLALLGGTTPLAVPRKLLNQHEIVNLSDWENRPIAVTYCPLTQSSLAFEREGVEGAEFEVSGLLLDNNLVMFEKGGEESLWSQMGRRAICGPQAGATLDMVPILDVRWDYWRTLHPDTKVLPITVNAGEASSEAESMTESERDPSGLVLGLPGVSRTEGVKTSADRGLALPFNVLRNDQAARVVDLSPNRIGPVVFWHKEARAAMAYRTSDTFSATAEGTYIDERTGSTWALDGRAIEGPREGERLDPVTTAYVAQGDPWMDFHPESGVWRDSLQ
jgi:hypothetical protein